MWIYYSLIRFYLTFNKIVDQQNGSDTVDGPSDLRVTSVLSTLKNRLLLFSTFFLYNNFLIRRIYDSFLYPLELIEEDRK